MRTVGLLVNAALAVLALTGAAASAHAASGLEPGVHVDPGSPAAKEYSLPLDQARQVGARSSSSGATSPQSPEGALFGAGIKPPGSGGGSHTPAAAPGASGAPSAQGHSGSTHGSGGPAQAGGAPGPQQLLAQTVLRAERDQGSGGGGSTLALLGGAVAVIVLGGLGGTVLRHSRRPT